MVGPRWAMSASSMSNPTARSCSTAWPRSPGVEGGHAVDHQGEAQGLGRLVGELAMAHVAVVGEVDRITKGVEALALVQLASDPLAEFQLLEVAEDEQGFD